MTQFRFPYFVLICLLTVILSCQPQPYSQGKVIYTYQCATCHMDDGSGLANLIPPLDSSKLTLSDPSKLVCLIRNGLPVNTLTGQQMPANKTMTDVEMANLINFLGTEYGLNTQTIKVTDVKKMLAGCQSD